MKFLPELTKKLYQYIEGKEEDICQYMINVEMITYCQLRERLLVLGNILEEDEENSLYVVAIPSGIFYSNTAILVIKLEEQQLYMVGYAKEGVIHQNTCKRAFQYVERGEKPVGVGKNYFFIIGIVIVILGLLVWIGTKSVSPNIWETQPIVESQLASGEAGGVATNEQEVAIGLHETQAYNQEVRAFNLAVEQYNQATQQSSVANIDGLPMEIEPLQSVSENITDIATSIENGNNLEAIILDTKTILGLTEDVKEATEVVYQITNPTEMWVMEQLKMVDSITGMELVTEENNPDGLLNQVGGYAACIYFTITQIDSYVSASDIVAKGTDAGGAIEVYQTLEGAEGRCEYLSGFDQTILYTGSYAIVGTMVVRTSYALTGEMQYELTDEIIQALTATQSDNPS